MVSEVHIHKALNHPNIVKFDHVFEDKENVYVVLELCSNIVSVLLWFSIQSLFILSQRSFLHFLDSQEALKD